MQPLTVENLGVIFRSYTPKLRRLLRFKMFDATDMEDIIQETFEKALRYLDTFRGESTPETWLSSIAINTMKNRGSSNKHNDCSIDDLDFKELPELISEDVSDFIQRNEEMSILTKAFGNLPAHSKEIMVMLIDDESTYIELAERIHIPINTARARIFRARAQWKNEIQRLSALPA